MVLWIIQRLSGVGLIGLLGVHFYLLHYLKPGQAPTSAEVFNRLQLLPLVFVDGALLLFALVHGLQGLYTIITDFDLAPRSRRWVAAICTCGAIGLFTWGIQILTAFFRQPL